MKLLNFSVGRVQTVRIGTADVRTAHVKAPIAEPWIITESGPEGDERAVHPDKVYAYARTGYDYWAQHLDRDAALWPDGFFGENLTFDVLDENELHVGDVLAVGSQVRLVVAGPRNPCLKLSWRLGQPATFQKVFQQSGRTGVYFDVLVPGRVRPGDTAEVIERAQPLPSVVETARFAAGHAIPPVEPLKQLLGFAHLSKTLRHILNSKLNASERAAASIDGRWRGWRQFVIDRIEAETHDVRSVYLRPRDGGRLCQPRPGQFVTARMTCANADIVTRCWSLSSHSETMSSYRLSVRRQQGQGSGWLHNACVGEEISLRAPSGDFTLDMGGYRPVVFIAAGIGITPVLAMLQAQLQRGTTGVPVYLIYGARSPEDMAFRSELAALAAAHSNFHFSPLYSRFQDGAAAPARITPERVISLLADNHVFFGGRRIELPWNETDMYICGPGDFCTELTSAFANLGANPDHIFFESFSAPAAVATDLESATVRFGRSGVECHWRADEDLTLLELGERAGLPLSSDCRSGACLTCKVRVTEGGTTMDVGDGHALLCVSRPTTRYLALDC